jgi:hypothetical protein
MAVPEKIKSKLIAAGMVRRVKVGDGEDFIGLNTQAGIIHFISMLF